MKTFNYWKSFLIGALIGALIGTCIVLYFDYNFNQRLDAMNAHIKELHEDGYSWEASRKIGATEAGFIPLDDEYRALKED